MSAVMKLLAGARSSSVAADTGSAAHGMIHAFNTGKEIAEAIEFVKTAKMFPQADLEEAERLFRAYAEDPRNDPKNVIFSEVQVNFKIGDIYITGTCDQVRQEEGTLAIWDYKTGKQHSGWDMLHVHALQLAAYTVGFEAVKNQITPLRSFDPSLPVIPGGIIRGQDYFKRKKKSEPADEATVFWHAAFERKDCDKLLKVVALRVAEIRNGTALFTPGDHCKYCPAGGVSNCLAIAKENGM